ncbi:hypothetical protein LLY42_26710 [Pseudomonas frederiksbergensis]|nr:hypothetical protein LLY42_26710 [Pseudomonas frederiksbergensis]
MIKVHLPCFEVVSEARDYLRAAQLIEQHAYNGNTDLFWPAAMNAGFASELYLKSFLVEPNPKASDGVLKGPRNHDLFALYKAIPVELAEQLRQISALLSPGFPLEDRIQACSNLFLGTRYTYEADKIQMFRTEVFELAPHLDLILTRMTQANNA